jgi:hypothetical protein
MGRIRVQSPQFGQVADGGDARRNIDAVMPPRFVDRFHGFRLSTEQQDFGIRSQQVGDCRPETPGAEYADWIGG